MLSDLERRTVAAGDARRYALTDTGEAIRSRIAEQVDVTRRLVDGVTRDEYLATVEVLQRMTANLEGTSDQRR